MTRVDFYVVSAGSPSTRTEVAVRLAEKARSRGHKLYINAQSEIEADQLDDLLWSMRPASFLPHHIVREGFAGDIVVGWGQEPVDHDDVLINLALAPPPFFSRFQRVAEVVNQDPSALEAMRDAWRFYRERGYPLQKHDL